MSTAVLIVNFGGPRHAEETASFLTELLTDIDVIRTPLSRFRLPRFVEKWFFTKIAQKRALRIAHDYGIIGGKSPLFEDTERLAQQLQSATSFPALAFHRYLPSTHEDFFKKLRTLNADKILVLPMYPQFSYSTTGSIARLFHERLPSACIQKLEWVRSYADHPSYLRSMQKCVQEYLGHFQLKEDEVFLFFSAHGLPEKFVKQGDPYYLECQNSYHALKRLFPITPSLLAFQSKFGPGKWLKPYTGELAKNPHPWVEGKKHVVFVPLTFTSDHLETLFEIEHTYLPLIRQQGLNAYRCPALNQREDWIETLAALLQTPTCSTVSLIR